MAMAAAESTPPKLAALTFRAPEGLTKNHDTSHQLVDFSAPSASFLAGAWHVTHSTLPMWKKNKNVVITYTALPSSPDSLDDLVEYSPLGSDSAAKKTVRGIDTPHATRSAAYGWRGKGWLKPITSQWEVLGHGEEEGGWMVTYFSKSLFTPAGLDVYAREKAGISEDLLKRIMAEMEKVEDDKFRRLVGEMFVITHEHGR